jgi:hypothetical protein
MADFDQPGINVPGGELILAEELRNKPMVIVNCWADMQHHGTAALRRLGLTNVRVKERTMGWVLAGYQLESQLSRRVAAPQSSN